VRLALGGALLIITACAAVPPEEDVPEAGVSAYHCDAEALRELVGRPATSELGAQALRRSGSRRLRWIRPGDMVTMDYSPERLNVRLDAQHRVQDFTCG
jgi:hypothetical protein